MDILKHGCFIETAICKNCGCEFTYNRFREVHYNLNDDRERTIAFKYVECPECNDKITIEKK